MHDPASVPHSTDSGTITLYRLVATDPPTARDMMSFAALGKPPRRKDPEILRLHDGVSTFDTLETVLRRARRAGFVATLTITPEHQRYLRVEQTTLEANHFTIWGEPRAILATVTGVQPIQPAPN